MTDGAIDLRCGDHELVLADVETDATITDPPYGQRTHAGQRHGRKDARYCDTAKHPNLSARGLGYVHWTPERAAAFARWVSSRTRSWVCIFTSHDLIEAYQDTLESDGWTTFAPLACVQHAMNVRLAGDGPSNWTTHLVVARRKSVKKWGSLRGAYVGPSHDTGENSLDRSKRAVAGAKPLWLMRAVVSDYTVPGWSVMDPCAGGGTTLLAAAELGCRAIGAEMDADTYAKACARLSRGHTPMPHPRAHKASGKARQAALW